jgi:hypothetical protein
LWLKILGIIVQFDELLELGKARDRAMGKWINKERRAGKGEIPWDISLRVDNKMT